MMNLKNNSDSKRNDGRHVSSLAAFMAQLREIKPGLKYDPAEDYHIWQTAVKEKLTELLQMPEFTVQPQPKRISNEQRNGYYLQRWEFYPDTWSTIPFLLLIPETKKPSPGVLCFPGSDSSKEFLAGESCLPHPNCTVKRFPERNMMALYYVKAGYTAVVFDNPGIAELAEFSPSDRETQWETRSKMSEGYLNYGLNYPGISVFQKLCFLDWFKQQNFVDNTKLAVSGHSLGAEIALFLGILCDDIKAVVFNDFLGDSRRRYTAITETIPPALSGNWHIIPGLWHWFGFPDLCAAMAPKFFCINEGGADEFINMVINAYQKNNVAERLMISYYPRYAAPASRRHDIRIPDHGLTVEEFYEYSMIDAHDHSFRAEASLKLLDKAFSSGG